MLQTTPSMTNPAPGGQRKIESRQCSDKCQISSAECPGLVLDGKTSTNSSSNAF